jgi:hypothetical protein
MMRSVQPELRRSMETGAAEMGGVTLPERLGWVQRVALAGVRKW